LRYWLAALLSLGLVSPVWARLKVRLPEPPPFSRHAHPSGAFTFQVPTNWTVGPVADDPDALEAAGDDLVVRFIYRSGEVGYDGLHATCMMQRLWGHMDADPDVRYEYDYVGGGYGPMRALDSAFVVSYETPFNGHRKWRQRNLTIVGAGHSLCLVENAPVSIWKKSGKARSIFEAIPANVKFKE
jgi:hypothetical protein